MGITEKIAELERKHRIAEKEEAETERVFSENLEIIKGREAISDPKRFAEVISKIEARQSHCREKFAEEIHKYNTNRRYLTQFLATENLTLQVTKTDWREETFYSLCLGNSPVFQYDGKEVKYLYSKNSSAPFEIRTKPAEEALQENENLSKELLELKPGSFCDEKGYVLTETQTKTAERIFKSASAWKFITKP